MGLSPEDRLSATTREIGYPWILCTNRRPDARLRLFCFPYAGGGAGIFRTWSDALPPTVEVCAVQLPGREWRIRETPFNDLIPLVQTLVPVLRPYFDIPFTFFGHSMGALIGFELARRLSTHEGRGPVHLFVSGCRAPQLPDPGPPIHALPRAAFVSELRRLNGTPEEVLGNLELMQLLLPTLRADFALCETYVYSPQLPLDSSISAFGGLQDAEVSHEELALWREQTRSSFTLRLFPGDHFFLHNVLSLMLQAVSQDLTSLLQQISPGEHI